MSTHTCLDISAFLWRGDWLRDKQEPAVCHRIAMLPQSQLPHPKNLAVGGLTLSAATRRLQEKRLLPERTGRKDRGEEAKAKFNSWPKIGFAAKVLQHAQSYHECMFPLIGMTSALNCTSSQDYRIGKQT